MADYVSNAMTVLSAQEAWDLIVPYGLSTVRVAIIDTGFAIESELDSQAKKDDVLSNRVEYRNFVNATDAVNGDVVTTTQPPSTLNGHGTWCQSICGAPHTGSGMAGAAPNVEFLCYRAFQDVGNHDWEEIKYAIKAAVDNGAKIISMSTGERWNAPLTGADLTANNHFQDAVDYCYNNDVLFVTSVGNSYDDLDDSSTFWIPAENNNILTKLGGTNEDFDNIWYEGECDPPEDCPPTGFLGSNYGSNLEICTPAQNVYGLYGNNYFSTVDGTSGCGPAVAGLAAMILGLLPNLTPQEVVNIIKATANTDAITSDENIGRKVNFEKSVTAAIALLETNYIKNTRNQYPILKDFDGVKINLKDFDGTTLY